PCGNSANRELDCCGFGFVGIRGEKHPRGSQIPHPVPAKSAGTRMGQPLCRVSGRRSTTSLQLHLSTSVSGRRVLHFWFRFSLLARLAAPVSFFRTAYILNSCLRYRAIEF